MATVFTYHEDVPGRPYPKKLLALWKHSWESRGWETKILSEKDAKDHPGYKAFSDRISRYPTVNPPGYERACYMRHLAMGMQEGGGLMTDYDVILRSEAKLGEGLSAYLCPRFPVILEPTRVPCAVLGDDEAWADLADIIFQYQFHSGENHVSDMTILRKTGIQTERSCIEHLCSGESIQDHLGDGWKTAPMIHFSTFSFSKLGWKGDKADLIQRVLATL